MGRPLAERSRRRTKTPAPTESWRGCATASEAAAASNRSVRAPGRWPRASMSSENPTSGRSCFLSGEVATKVPRPMDADQAAVGDELVQRLAHRDAADLELLAKLALGGHLGLGRPFP